MCGEEVSTMSHGALGSHIGFLGGLWCINNKFFVLGSAINYSF